MIDITKFDAPIQVSEHLDFKVSRFQNFLAGMPPGIPCGK